MDSAQPKFTLTEYIIIFTFFHNNVLDDAIKKSSSSYFSLYAVPELIEKFQRRVILNLSSILPFHHHKR